MLVDASVEQLEEMGKRAEEEHNKTSSPTPSRRGILRIKSDSDESESSEHTKKCVRFHESCKVNSRDKDVDGKLNSGSSSGDESERNGEASDSVKKSKKKVAFKGVDEEESLDQGPWI